jgi:hypothetical protein
MKKGVIGMIFKNETFFVHKAFREISIGSNPMEISFCVARTFARATTNSGEDIPELASTFVSAFHGDNASLWEATLAGSKMIWTRPENIWGPQELRAAFMEEVEKELRRLR